MDSQVTSAFQQSSISEKMNHIRKASLAKSEDQLQKDLLTLASIMDQIVETGFFEREIEGQLVDSGKSIRDGKRKVTFSIVKSSKDSVTFQEDVDSVRTEYENIKGQRGPVKILNRVLKRSTRIEISRAADGGLKYKMFRLGKEEETVTSEGYVLVENGVVFMAGQSRISDYPVTETTSVKGFSQSLKQISAKDGTLITDAVTLKVPENPNDPYVPFGEWDSVTSQLVRAPRNSAELSPDSKFFAKAPSLAVDADFRNINFISQSKIQAVAVGQGAQIFGQVGAAQGRAEFVGFVTAKWQTKLSQLVKDNKISLFASSKKASQRIIFEIVTDFTERLSQEIGATVSYQKEFQVDTSTTKVTLQLSDFELVSRGKKLAKQVQLITSEEPGQNQKMQSLKSVGFLITRGQFDGARVESSARAFDFFVQD